MSKTVFEVIGMGSKKYGGFEKYIVEEARQLKAKGYELVVIFDREPLAKDYINDLYSLGVKVEIVPQPTLIKFACGFIKLLKKYHPEIVHTNFSSNLFAALPLGRLWGAKRLIASDHCLPSKSGLKSRLVAQVIAIIADNVLLDSNMSAQHLKEATFYGKGKMKVLHLGVEDDHGYNRDEVRCELGIRDDIIAMMNIAYHNPVKGVDVLLEALNILVNRMGANNLVLYQIGGGQTGHDTEALYRQAEKLNIMDNIKWMGVRNDVPCLLSAADIYVQPSRSEGMPLSIMEASFAALPVVATKVGGNPEAAIDNENALIVPSEDPESMAKAIYTLYTDSEKRHTFGHKSREIAVDKFSLRNNVSKLIETYYRI